VSRDWVKLHTGMLGHVGTMRLSDAAFRLWITLLMFAGQTDDDGRAATCEDVLYYLRWTDTQLSAAITELNGRVAVEGSTIHVRDWADWQPKIDPTNAKRQAGWRERQAEELEALRAAANVVGVGCHVTSLRNDDRNAGRNGATRAQEPVEPVDTEEPVEPVEQQSGMAGATPPPPEPHWAHGSDAYNAVADALVNWLDVNPDVLHPGTRKAVLSATRAILLRGFTGANVETAEKLWYAEHWRGKDAKRPESDRVPNVKEAQDWLAAVDYRVRPEVTT
jgi:hypothetical protein